MLRKMFDACARQSCIGGDHAVNAVALQKCRYLADLFAIKIGGYF